MAASALLTGCGAPLAAAATSLRGVLDAQVVDAAGTVRPAFDGLTLRRGDVVRTGAAGRAELVTRQRVVYVGSQASVEVLDGARQQLRRGAVVVDAQHGAGLDLTVGSLDVATPAGSAVRAERAVTSRVGTLAGTARVDSDTGRALTLPPLSQVVAGGDALPAAATPLRLTDDDGEARAVPSLVRDDVALDGLARGIDTTGTGAAHAVTASWPGPVSGVPTGVARSEQVLPMLLAAARPTDRAARYTRAVALRAAGGSWGVVARLLGTNAAAALAGLSRAEAASTGGGSAAGPAGAAVVAAGTGGALDALPGGSGGGRHPRAGGGSAGGGPSTTPTPTPTQDPVGSLVSTAQNTVDDLLSLVPLPTGSARPAQVPAAPTPIPRVTPSPTGLLGTVTSILAPGSH